MKLSTEKKNGKGKKTERNEQSKREKYIISYFWLARPISKWTNKMTGFALFKPLPQADMLTSTSSSDWLENPPIRPQSAQAGRVRLCSSPFSLNSPSLFYLSSFSHSLLRFFSSFCVFARLGTCCTQPEAFPPGGPLAFESENTGNYYVVPLYVHQNIYKCPKTS